jgi:hypothetical protein
MISIDIKVGRLIEVRSVQPYTIEEIAVFGRRLAQIMQDRQGAARVVGCLDLRGASVVPAEHTELYTAMFRRDNPQVERTGVLLPAGQATLTLQIERIVREANNPRRKTFRDIPPLCAYLDEVLSPEEKARMRAFLAGG